MSLCRIHASLHSSLHAPSHRHKRTFSHFLP
jgi:hypothetical protein